MDLYVLCQFADLVALAVICVSGIQKQHLSALINYQQMESIKAVSTLATMC
jgi:hypothetical protein